MPVPTEFADLPAEKRLQRLARLFARAVLKLHIRTALATSEKSAESAETSLAVSGDLRLSVSHALQTPETSKNRSET